MERFAPYEAFQGFNVKGKLSKGQGTFVRETSSPQPFEVLGRGILCGTIVSNVGPATRIAQGIRVLSKCSLHSSQAPSRVRRARAIAQRIA